VNAKPVPAVQRRQQRPGQAEPSLGGLIRVGCGADDDGIMPELRRVERGEQDGGGTLLTRMRRSKASEEGRVAASRALAGASRRLAPRSTVHRWVSRA
jgi:hypothetical protein